MRTVRGRNTLEVVTLHNTGETFTLAGAHDVNELTGFEHISIEFLTHLVISGVRGANLGYVTARRDACLLEVAFERRGNFARVNGTRSDLDGFVAIDLYGADLGHDIRCDRNHGDRNHTILVIPHLSHTELDAQYTSRCSHC